MSKHLEIETKYMLSSDSYQKLKKWMMEENGEQLEQTNYYLDTLDFQLEHLDLGTRIRKEKYIELTVKMKQKEGKLEVNQLLNEIEFEEFLQTGILPSGEVKDALKKQGWKEEKLYVFATLTTKRVELPFQEGILDLDESHYFDQIDYEIEYESDSLVHGTMVLQLLFKKLEISDASPSQYTKLARAKKARKK